MSKNKLFIFSFLLMTVTAKAQSVTVTASQILNQIHTEYAQRFDSAGRQIDDQNLTNQFKASQIQAIQILRKNNMIGQSFQIKNSAMSNLIVTVSIVQEQNSDFAGLLIERNKYDHPDSEALLRLFNFPILAGGMSTLTFNGATVVHIKSQGLNSAEGGTVVLKYPTDFNSNQFSQMPIAIFKDRQGFAFKSPAGGVFQTMFLQVWYKLFSKNFGIENVSFQ